MNKRILLDTNVYGKIMDLPNSLEFASMINKSQFTVCGSTVIREELRDIPKKKIIKNVKLRKLALEIYDDVVDEKRNYSVTELVKTLAQEYNKNYLGTRSWKELEKDFLIVATASLHATDLVVSNDEKTLTSQDAIKAYQISNKKFELLTPRFIKFEEFKDFIK